MVAIYSEEVDGERYIWIMVWTNPSVLVMKYLHSQASRDANRVARYYLNSKESYSQGFKVNKPQ